LHKRFEKEIIIYEVEQMNFRTVFYVALLVGIGMFSCELAHAIDCTRAEAAAACSYMEMLEEEEGTRNTAQPIASPAIEDAFPGPYWRWPDASLNLTSSVKNMPVLSFELFQTEYTLDLVTRSQIIEVIHGIQAWIPYFLVVREDTTIYVTVMNDEDGDSVWATTTYFPTTGRIEIRLTPEWLTRDIKQSVITMVHEIVHAKQNANGFIFMHNLECAVPMQELEAYREAIFWGSFLNMEEEDINGFFELYAQYLRDYNQHCVGSK
jgi:hypothetical protein